MLTRKRNYLILSIYIIGLFLVIYGLFGWFMAAEQPWYALAGLIILAIVRNEELHEDEEEGNDE